MKEDYGNGAFSDASMEMTACVVCGGNGVCVVCDYADGLH